MRFLKSIISIFFILFLSTILVEAAPNTGTWVHLVNIANPIPLEEITQKYSAYDYYDGDLSGELIFTTDYSHTTCEIGKYDLIVSVKNSKNKVFSQTDQIIVRDFIAPTIVSTVTEIHIKIGDSFTKENLSPYLNYYDNLDDDLQLIIDNFPADTLEEGIYHLKIYCVDSSTNVSNVINITLYVEDYRNKEILNYTLTTNSIIDKNEVLAILKENNYLPSKYKTIEISSSFFDKDPNPGIYPTEVVLTLEDNSIKVLYFKIEYIKNTKEFPLWILYVIGGLTIFTTFFIIIYRKRAQ